MTAARIDLSIRQGNDTDVTLAWGAADDPADLTGRSFVWTLKWGAWTLRKSSEAGTVTVAGDTVAMEISRVESRQMPAGGLVQHELECRYGGKETTWAFGTITVEAGINDDAP